MKINGTVEVEISEKELAHAIGQKLFEMTEVDDVGCDWFTKGNKTYIGTEDWFVSSDPLIASMVDTMNYLRYGEVLTLED